MTLAPKRAKISQFVFNDPSRKNLKTVGRRYMCTYENCEALFYTYRSLALHLERIHECITCLKYYPDLEGHVCEPEIQTGGSVQTSTTLPEGFNPAPFTLGTTVHKKTLMSFFLKIDETVDNIPDCQALVMEPLSNLILKLLTMLGGAKILIQIECVMEKVETFQQKVVEFNAAFMRYIHPSIELVESNIISSFELLESMVSVWIVNGSLWRLKQVTGVQFRIGQYSL